MKTLSAKESISTLIAFYLRGQDCNCDEGCQFCMIELQLRAKCEGSDKMSVTSGMFELVPNQRVRPWFFPVLVKELCLKS